MPSSPIATAPSRSTASSGGGGGEGKQHLSLSFARLREPEIEEGIAALARRVRDSARKKRRRR